MSSSRRAVLGSAVSLLAARRAAAQAPGPSQAEALPLGALFPFSGMMAVFGDECYRGLELAADERNGAGGLFGRTIKLLKGDAVDSNAAISEVKRLLGTEKVGAVFGTFAGSLAIAASQITELAGVPYFELEAAEDPVTERGFKSLFRSCPQAGAIGRLSVDTVAESLAPRWTASGSAIRIGILHEDGLLGATVSDAQAARCRELGLSVVDNLAYNSATTDLGSAVQRFRGANVTVILHTAYQNDAVLFYRQMKQAGWLPLMVIGTGGGYALTDTASTVGTDYDGTLYVGFPPYDIERKLTPGLADIEAAYERRYGGKPRSGHSLAAYVGGRIFLDGLARAGSMDKDKLRAALLETDLEQGRTSNSWGVKFDDKGQNLRAFPVISQWFAGKLRTVLPTQSAVATLRPTLGS